MEKGKEYNQHYLLAKVRTTEEKRRTGSDSGRTNATKTVSGVFRHRSRTGKSYCRTRSDVGLEIVNQNLNMPIRFSKSPSHIQYKFY
jgi:hypothetical protein